MVTIRLTNSMSHRKEAFAPIDAENVRMYVCGPTVYDRAHIGNARPVVVFDTLFRLLRHVYGADHVTYVRNFTDVDDKINAEALRRKGLGRTESLEALIQERTEETIAWYHEDMDALGALRPAIRDDRTAEGLRKAEPRATEYIGAMVTMIEGLIAKGHAYAREGHVLFRVRSYEKYGVLSGRSIDDMIAGARVEVAPFKEDPMDFVLWKPSDADEPGWDSPWGRGRPGWHIECSAMSYALLGESFDIHGGGLDLQFPHHENEIAQSCCAHPKASFAKYWLHNEMLQVEGKKMSKSLGNFFTVRDLLDQGYPGEVIRMVYLGTHYSKPMDWTHEKAVQAEATLRKWRRALAGVKTSIPYESVHRWIADDLNTPTAIAELHAMFVRIEKAASGNASALFDFEIDPSGRNRSFEDALAEMKSSTLASAQMLGLLDDNMGTWADAGIELAPYAEKLRAFRETAMTSKDFAPVDALKSALIAAGLEVRMSKAGVELVPGAGFDVTKLEGLL